MAVTGTLGGGTGMLQRRFLPWTNVQTGKKPPKGVTRGGRGSAVEIEVARRLLLEPEAVVLGRVL